MGMETISIGAYLVIGAVCLLLFALYVFTIFWAWGDANSRGKPGCLVALLVAFLSWPLGLVLWVIFRPNERTR